MMCIPQEGWYGSNSAEAVACCLWQCSPLGWVCRCCLWKEGLLTAKAMLAAGCRPPVSRTMAPRSAGGRTAGAVAPAGDDPVCDTGALPHVRRRAAAGPGRAPGVCSPEPPARWGHRMHWPQGHCMQSSALIVAPLTDCSTTRAECKSMQPGRPCQVSLLSPAWLHRGPHHTHGRSDAQVSAQERHPVGVCAPHAGADGSWVNMLQPGRGPGSTQSTVAQPARPHPFHTDIKVSPAAVRRDAGDR